MTASESGRPAASAPAPSHRLRGSLGARTLGHVWRGERGQSAVETVCVLPLMIAVALAIGHVLSAGLARELAGHAAEAGAIAVLQGGDAKDAAAAALPEWARDRIDVDVDARRVRVRLEPLAAIPGVADRLASTATADAGSPDAVARATLRALDP